MALLPYVLEVSRPSGASVVSPVSAPVAPTPLDESAVAV
jgi:hypothetical protein